MEGSDLTLGRLLNRALPCAVAAGLALGQPAQARKWPRPPGWWLTGAYCVHRGESTNWHIHNEPYGNGFQFMRSTWVRAGGDWSTWYTAEPAEQLYRAWIIWKQDGGSWREWPNTSRACGLR